MRWSFLFLGIGLAGCGYESQYVQLNTPPHAMTAKAPEQVQVFTSSAPTQPFVEVGLVSARGQSTANQDQNELIQTLRQGAAQAGCDGIMNLRPNNRVAMGPNGGGTMIGYEASCIVFKDAPAAAATPAAAPQPAAPPAS